MIYTGVHRGCLQTFFLFFIFILKIFSKKLCSPQPDLQNFRRNNFKHFFFSEKKVGFLLFFSRYYTFFFSVFLPDFPKSSIFCQKRILVDPTKKVSFSAFSGWLSEKGGCKTVLFTLCIHSVFCYRIYCFSLLLLMTLFFIGILFLYFGPFIAILIDRHFWTPDGPPVLTMDQNPKILTPRSKKVPRWVCEILNEKNGFFNFHDIVLAGPKFWQILWVCFLSKKV